MNGRGVIGIILAYCIGISRRDLGSIPDAGKIMSAFSHLNAMSDQRSVPISSDTSLFSRSELALICRAHMPKRQSTTHKPTVYEERLQTSINA